MKGDLVLEFNRNSLASRSIWTSNNGSYFNLFVSILIQSYISSNLHVSILYIQLHGLHIKTTNYVKNGTIGVKTIDVTTTLQQNNEHVHQQ